MRAEQSRRAVTRIWTVAAGCLALSCLVIWLAGGFALAPGRGRPVGVSEPITLARWVIQVDRAQYVDTAIAGYEQEPSIRIWMRVAFTGQETICCMAEKQIEVTFGQATLKEGRPVFGAGRQFGFDPDIQTALVQDFVLPDKDDAVTALPDTVTVLVRDEAQRENFVFGDVWEVTDPEAAVELSCPDHRQRR